MTTLEFTLPVPPSVNHLYANSPRGGRIRTKKYRAWIKEAGWALNLQHVKPITGRYRLAYIVPRNPRRDLSNHEKCMTDLLVKHRIVPDDKHLDHLEMDWGDREDVHVAVRAA